MMCSVWSEEGVGAVDEEVVVFEEAEGAEVEHERCDEGGAACALRGGLADEAPGEEVGEGDGGDEEEEAPVPAGVEEVAGDEQEGVAQVAAAVEEGPVEGYGGYKEVAKCECVEQHRQYV